MLGTSPATTTAPDEHAANLQLLPVENVSDVLENYRENAVGDLLRSHNLGIMPEVTPKPDALIVTCMDFRISLDLPEFFAFQVRTAGAHAEPVLSNIAFAVACAGIRVIAVIGHSDCAMCRVDGTTDEMCSHLIDDSRWSPDEAAKQAVILKHEFGISDPVEATWRRGAELARRFPSALVAPLFYRVEDGSILQIAPA